MELIAAHTRATFLMLFRLPVFVVSTVGFPVVLFLFVGMPQADGPLRATGVCVGFCAYALLGVAVFEFGVGVANEREAPWEYYVRTLGASPALRLAARALASLAFGVIATVPVLVLALAVTPVRMSAATAATIAALLLFGALVFNLFGLSVGYWVRAAASVAVANVLFFPLAFLGRLFGPETHFSGTIDRLSRLLPVRMWSDQLYGTVAGAPIRWPAIGGLVAWGAAFALVALAGYRRDELRKYR